MFKITYQTRRAAIDQLSAAQTQFQERLEAVQKQRDEARASVDRIKGATESLWKERVDVWRDRARSDRKKQEETEQLLKKYQEWNIEGNVKIDELPAKWKDLKYDLDIVESERDLALKETQHPSWKLEAQLKYADKELRYKTQALARLEARKGKYQKLTPPISKVVTSQEELISDLTSGLILLSKWCDLKKLTEVETQTKRLQTLLSDPEDFPYEIALQTISLLVRQLSFVHLHLVEGHSQGPGDIQPPHLFDIEGLSTLVSQHQNLSVESQIDFNCCYPEGFSSLTPTYPPEDYRRAYRIICTQRLSGTTNWD